MSDVHVAGVSMTHFGKYLDRSLKDLAGEALGEVLKDAGCETGMLEAVFFGNCVQGHMEGQDMVRGEIALRSFGIEGIPVINVENACATASTAFHMGGELRQGRRCRHCARHRRGKKCTPMTRN